MLYSTIVQRNEEGFQEMYNAARQFENENLLEALIACKLNKKKVEQILNLTRIYQARLNIESMDLVEFSENFIEEYATDHNECFRLTEKLIRRIGTTITGSMKLFRKFCPVVRRKLDGAGNVVPTLDYSRLTFRQFYGQLFGVEAYIDLVKTLLQEMSSFFYHLITVLKLCKDMIRKEEEVLGDTERLIQIFNDSCDQVLHSVREVFKTFNNVKLVSDEELAERRKNARPIKEWIAKEYHKHDKKWLMEEGIIRRLVTGNQYGLDDKAALLWDRNPEWGRKVCDIIPKLDMLSIPFRKSKKAELQGKEGTFEATEMVYFIKWSAVSYMSNNGTEVKDEAKERQLYRYVEEKYKGKYILPSWQAVCAARKFLYRENISMQEMANNFAKYIENESKVA